MRVPWPNADELKQKLAEVRDIEGQRKDHCAELYRRPGHERRMQILRSLLAKLVPQYDFIDVGCAEGLYCGLANEFGAHRVLGIDISPTKIQRALERYPTCEFVCRDMFDLHDLTGQFDVALCCEVLQHVLDYQLAAQTVISCLRPGGYAIFTTSNLSESPHHIPATVSSDMTAEQLLVEIGGAGFGKQNAVWKFNTDKLYEEIARGCGVTLLEKIPVDTPDGQRKNLWTIGVMQVNV